MKKDEIPESALIELSNNKGEDDDEQQYADMLFQDKPEQDEPPEP